MENKKGDEKRSVSLKVLTTGIILIAFALVVYFVIHTETSAWKIYNQKGLPRVDGKNVISVMDMEPGEILKTNSTSSAYVHIPGIGKINVEPGTELQRLNDSSLRLKEGIISVTKTNAQKYLSILVPSAEIKDLYLTGSYTIKLFDNGNSIVNVYSSTEIVKNSNKEMLVPENYLCEVRKGIGPGIPFYKNASDSLVKRLSDFAFNGSEDALKDIQNLATISDAASLWNILRNVKDENRANVFDALNKIMSMPQGVTKEGILSLNNNMMNKWYEGITVKLFSKK